MPKKKAEAAPGVEEHEAQERLIERLCMGPILPAAEVIKQDLHSQGKVDEAMVLNSGFRGIISEEDAAAVTVLLNEGDVEGAKVHFANTSNRCNTNLNDTIMALGFEGEAFSVNCPGCGITVTGTTSLFPKSE